MNEFTSFEICAGAGGQALGLEWAGFDHAALVEIDSSACATLRMNRPNWRVIEADVQSVSGAGFGGVDLVAGGVPCPPFSKAGKQLGPNDERDLFPEALRLIEEIRPRAVMLENVRGLMDAVFDDYRMNISSRLKRLGYVADWKIIQASDFGVSQLRPRVVCVALRTEISDLFEWPTPISVRPPSVGELLFDLMGQNGWEGAASWRAAANGIAPTLVGGSKKHGGPDLGPSRSKKAWATLSVDGHGVWDDAPARGYVGIPRLTPRMAARVQGFPDEWVFSGKKTAAYRQIGNAFPPPVARAVGGSIRTALTAALQKRVRIQA